MQGEGGNGGSNDAGHDRRRRNTAQGAEQAVEAGGGWVLETSRWKVLRASKGRVERVEMRGAYMTTNTDGVR